MGFRGSRVQIPPSRLISKDLRFATLTGARWGPVSRTNRAVPKLPLLAHHGEERFVIWPCVAGEQCHRVFPAACLGHVGHGQVRRSVAHFLLYGCQSPPSRFFSPAFFSAC